jgi:hypothetical protein
MNPMNGADLYQKQAAEHSDLMKDASSPFLRMYHQRIVERYLLHVAEEPQSWDVMEPARRLRSLMPERRGSRPLPQ